ncbi:NEW3 domain-containing protein [Brachybacterium fresconis]|uniref:Alpha-galactosidase NEW3 domain-containing protein n=1 Tax=Brachybacterium fresconis TaxID=173363 RepID=A0ABS4YN20_9MICO|nr:NEW3 domain-containing protein [Brachybacterium fresconis]MBP2410199.1 hypothetical protein [Brachybacterium fresconis]
MSIENQTPTPTTARPGRTVGAISASARALGILIAGTALLLGAMLPAQAATQAPYQIGVRLTPLDLADQDTIQTLTVTVTNSSRQAMTETTIALNGPAGWTTAPAQRTVDDPIAAGGTVTESFQVRVPTLREGFRMHPFAATVTYRGGDGHGTVVQEKVMTTGTPIASLQEAYNNVGVTTLAARAKGDFDGDGNSFSAEQLGEAGVVPGAAVEGAGAQFTWPDVKAGAQDNATATGQAISLSGSGSDLAFLAAGSGLNATGTATVFYTDGTTSTGTISVPNWTGAGANPDAEVVAATKGRNTPDGYANENGTYSVHAVSIPLEQGNQIETVVLPGNGSIHVFDMQVVD